MNPDKLRQLQALLGSLPPRYVGPIAAAVERDRLAGGSAFPHEAMLDALRPLLRSAEARIQRLPSPLRVFATPFEDVLTDRLYRGVRSGIIRRTSIRPVWTWLTEQAMPVEAATLVNELRAALLEGKSSVDAAAQILRQRTAAMIFDALGHDVSDPDALKKRACGLGSADIAADAIAMAEFLSIGDAIGELRRTIPRETHDALPWETRGGAIHAENLKPIFGRDDLRDDGRTMHLIFVLMGRLAQPHDVLSLTGLVSERFDAMLKPAHAGARLLAELGDAAEAVCSQRAINLDGDALVNDFNRFGEGVVEIEKALGLRMDRAWEQALNQLRASIAEPVENLLERMPREIAAALPVQRMGSFGPRGPRRPDLSHDPDPQKVARAIRAAQIAAGVAPLAAAGAVASAVYAAMQDAGQALRLYVEDLLIDLRATEDEERARVDAYADAAAEIAMILLGPEEGEIIRRRIAAARNANAA